jgi:hypothetical protein
MGAESDESNAANDPARTCKMWLLIMNKVTSQNAGQNGRE